jgi:hypothetical protein
MRKQPLKFRLMIAQGFTLFAVAGYIIVETRYFFLIGFAFLVSQGLSRCGSCRTAFTDDRLNAHLHPLRFWKTEILDKCPVCGDRMYKKSVKS